MTITWSYSFGKAKILIAIVHESLRRLEGERIFRN